MYVQNEDGERSLYVSDDDIYCYNCRFKEVCTTLDLVQQGAFKLVEDEIIIETCYFYEKGENE